jgi:hypothetical protein
MARPLPLLSQALECRVSDLSVLVVMVALVAMTAGFLAVLDGVLTKGGRR